MQKLVPTFSISAILLLPSALAATIDLGSAKINASNSSGLNSTNAHVTGLASGITFDVNITSNLRAPSAQTTGLGVSGGTAGGGLDNNDDADPSNDEALTFTIINVTGLGSGESLVFTGFQSSFGFNGGEFYAINGGPVTAFESSPETHVLPNSTSFTMAAAGGGTSRFSVSQLQVEVIPEPSSALLIGLGLVGFGVRRRR